MNPSVAVLEDTSIVREVLYTRFRWVPDSYTGLIEALRQTAGINSPEF